MEIAVRDALGIADPAQWTAPVRLSGTTDGSGRVCWSPWPLGLGDFVAEVTNPPDGYLQPPAGHSAVRFTVDCLHPVDAPLFLAFDFANYVCCDGCVNPIPKTLHAAYPGGTFDFTYSPAGSPGTPPWHPLWLGSASVAIDPACAGPPCAPGPATVTVDFRLTCSADYYGNPVFTVQEVWPIGCVPPLPLAGGPCATTNGWTCQTSVDQTVAGSCDPVDLIFNLPVASSSSSCRDNAGFPQTLGAGTATPIVGPIHVIQ
jgi:hypothetical protein